MIQNFSKNCLLGLVRKYFENIDTYIHTYMNVLMVNRNKFVGSWFGCKSELTMQTTSSLWALMTSSKNSKVSLETITG